MNAVIIIAIAFRKSVTKQYTVINNLRFFKTLLEKILVNNTKIIHIEQKLSLSD